jgi:hypothetical protein
MLPSMLLLGMLTTRKFRSLETSDDSTSDQGLTLVPNSAQLELFSSPYNLT